MPKEITLEAVLNLDPTLAIVAAFGVVVSNSVNVQLVVKYRGLSIHCDSVADVAELAQHAIQQHARARFATDAEAREAGLRVVEKHRASLEKLAAHDGVVVKPTAADAVDPHAGSTGTPSTRENNQ